MTKFGTIIQAGKNIFLGVSHVPIPRGRDPGIHRIFWALGTPRRFDLDLQLTIICHRSNPQLSSRWRQTDLRH